MTAINHVTLLVEQIKKYLVHDDIDDQVEHFISMGENRIFREVRTLEDMATETEQPILASDGLCEANPIHGLWEVQGVAIDSVYPRYKPEFVPRINWSAIDGEVGGFPRYYTTGQEGLYFKPFPQDDEEHTATFDIYRWPSSILWTTGGPWSIGTNRILVDAPDLYLYASLLAAEAYLVNDPRIATWEKLYTDSRDSYMKAVARMRQRPGDGRMRSASSPHEGRARRY